MKNTGKMAFAAATSAAAAAAAALPTFVHCLDN
jgi:hypothetical protein